MTNNLIAVHTIVKNEEQWIWYALMSVINYVDKILVFDTGSTDQTVRIINSIKSHKIIFYEKGNVDRAGLVKLRQEQLKMTTTDWFMLVDGDEIWPEPAIKRVLKAVKKANNNLWEFVVGTRNCVCDIWHYQSEQAGRYRLAGRKGHLMGRIYRKVKKFRWLGKYPNEAYCDDRGVAIHNQPNHLSYINVKYWHLSHLYRSSESRKVFDRKKKLKLELGIKAKKSELPRVFFKKRPSFIPSPWLTLSPIDRLKTIFFTPLKAVKRKINI